MLRRCASFVFISLLSFIALSCEVNAKKAAPHEKKQNSSREQEVSVEFLSGKFSPVSDVNFTYVPNKFSSRRQFIAKDTLHAFEALAKEALRAGFHLQIVSATRNFSTQRMIWDGKFSGQRKVGGKDLSKTLPNETERALKILEFSSMPGTSRHHWGTDLDIHALEVKGPVLTNATFKSGTGLKFYTWLVDNAPRLGFCQPYTGSPQERNNGMKHGYQEERWHWSFKPLAAKYLTAYEQNIKALRPKGFAGDKAAAGFFSDFVFNVDSSCKNNA